MDGFEKRKQQKKEDILNASLTLFKKNMVFKEYL